MSDAVSDPLGGARDPPSYAVVFPSVRTPADPAGYAETAARMEELASRRPGYLGVVAGARHELPGQGRRLALTSIVAVFGSAVGCVLLNRFLPFTEVRWRGALAGGGGLGGAGLAGSGEDGGAPALATATVDALPGIRL